MCRTYGTTHVLRVRLVKDSLEWRGGANRIASQFFVLKCRVPCRSILQVLAEVFMKGHVPCRSTLQALAEVFMKGHVPCRSTLQVLANEFLKAAKKNPGMWVGISASVDDVSDLL